MTDRSLAQELRLLVVTDRALASPRRVEDVVAAALEGGARAVQLRNKGDAPRDLLALGRDLRGATRSVGALLLVNDRVDVALALDADGAHLGEDDLPLDVARRVVGDGFLLGASCDRPDAARRAVDQGADYIGCGTVYSTSTKRDAGEVIGTEGLARVVAAVSVPVLGIGGIHAAVAGEVARTGAAGIAVVGAVMSADDPGDATRRLIGAFESGRSA